MAEQRERNVVMEPIPRLVAPRCCYFCKEPTGVYEECDCPKAIEQRERERVYKAAHPRKRRECAVGPYS